jgi:hypothetical protein
LSAYRKAVEGGLAEEPSVRDGIPQDAVDPINIWGGKGLYVSDEIIEKLHRLRLLNSAFEAEASAFDLLFEATPLQDELVSLFLPLVELLIKTGMLDLSTEVFNASKITDNSTVFAAPTNASADTGKIRIHAMYTGAVSNGPT